MTGVPPGFADEIPEPSPPQYHFGPQNADISDGNLPPGPIFLESGHQPALQRIDPAWEPPPIRTNRKPASQVPWIGGGLAILFGSWLLLSLIAFASGQIHESRLTGGIVIVTFSFGILLLLRGVFGELTSYRKLHQVSRLRSALQQDDIAISELVVLCRAWLMSIRQRFPNAEVALQRINLCHSGQEVRAILRNQLLQEMQEAAILVGHSAAMKGGGLIAITPSPVLEAALATLLGVDVVRQVAQIYGIRPGMAVTLALFRRVALTAASVSGLELLSQRVADELFHTFPGIKQLAASVPGASLAAVRLYRLANITAAACSPVSLKAKPFHL